MCRITKYSYFSSIYFKVRGYEIYTFLSYSPRHSLLGMSSVYHCANDICISRWRHDVETISALLAICEVNPPVADGFPSQRVSKTGFGVFFGVRLNKRLSKQSTCQWYKMSWRLWHTFPWNLLSNALSGIQHADWAHFETFRCWKVFIECRYIYMHIYRYKAFGNNSANPDFRYIGMAWIK